MVRRIRSLPRDARLLTPITSIANHGGSKRRLRLRQSSAVAVCGFAAAVAGCQGASSDIAQAPPTRAPTSVAGETEFVSYVQATSAIGEVPSARIRQRVAYVALPVLYTWWGKSHNPGDRHLPGSANWDAAPEVKAEGLRVRIEVRARTLPREVSITTGPKPPEESGRPFTEILAFPDPDAVGVTWTGRGHLIARWAKGAVGERWYVEVPVRRLREHVLVAARWYAAPDATQATASRIWFFMLT